jgi:hypothetical protein
MGTGKHDPADLTAGARKLPNGTILYADPDRAGAPPAST